MLLEPGCPSLAFVRAGASSSPESSSPMASSVSPRTDSPILVDGVLIPLLRGAVDQSGAVPLSSGAAHISSTSVLRWHSVECSSPPRSCAGRPVHTLRPWKKVGAPVSRVCIRRAVETRQNDRHEQQAARKRKTWIQHAAFTCTDGTNAYAPEARQAHRHRKQLGTSSTLYDLFCVFRSHRMRRLCSQAPRGCPCHISGAVRPGSRSLLFPGSPVAPVADVQAALLLLLSPAPSGVRKVWCSWAEANPAKDEHLTRGTLFA